MSVLLAAGVYTVHSFLAGVLDVFPNMGISFGWRAGVLVWVSFLLLIVVGFLSFRKNDLGLMLVAVGGVTNFIDRIVFGYVRDYWNLGFCYNNLADWVIFLGVIYSLYKLWKVRE